MTEIINKKPMTIGEIFKISFSFILKNLPWIVFLSLAINLPGLLSLLEEALYGQKSLSLSIVSFLSSLIFTPLFGGTVSILIGERFLGRQISFFQGLKKSFKKWISLILLALAIAMAGFFGILFFIIPGFIVACAVACATPAMMLEDLKPMAAFDRSWELTKKNRLRIFGYLVLEVLIFVSAVMLMVPFMLAGIMNPLFFAAIVIFLMAGLQALTWSVSTLLFIDLRNQKEAIELEKANQVEIIVPNEIS